MHMYLRKTCSPSRRKMWLCSARIGGIFLLGKKHNFFNKIAKTFEIFFRDKPAIRLAVTI